MTEGCSELRAIVNRIRVSYGLSAHHPDTDTVDSLVVTVDLNLKFNHFEW